MFQDPGFRDAFRVLPVYFRVIGFEDDPLHPTRPHLIFAGEVRDGQTMTGRAQMTPDEQLRWKWVRLRIYWPLVAYKCFRSVGKEGNQSGGTIFYPL